MINNTTFDRHDGAAISNEEITAIILNFPMWFGQELIDEINEKNVTVCVFIDREEKRHIHLENADHDLSIKVAKRFPFF